MGISEASADLMLTRDREGRRIYRSGPLRRRVHEVRDATDYAAVVSYARWQGLITLGFLLANAVALAALGGGRSALIVAAVLAVVGLSLIHRRERILVTKLER